MQLGVYVSLAVYFAVMLGIGLYSYLKTKNDVSGFMLGGRSLSPSVTALSAGASDMSGWMLMGLPGAMYLSGLGNVWIAVGLSVGAYLNYLTVAPRLRVYTEVAGDAVTIPEFFERRFEDHNHIIRVICAIVIVVFFAIYTTSGVVAGGKLFETSFDMSYQVGVMVTAGVVVAYSAFGGFLAVSTTDFVQGCIMFVALILVPSVALYNLGGIEATQAQIIAIDPSLLSLGGVSTLAIISAASWGLGYFGQPHIIVRFMAIRSVKEMKVARRIGMSWMIVSLIGATMVGIVGLAYISATGASLKDPEAVFIFLSTTLFHPLISGFLLAAILAAIMSTISSQLLVTSSSLTEDLYKTFLRKSASPQELVMVGRLSVVAVAVLAVLLAQDRDSSILSLVSNAWAGFGSAFGPVVLISLFWKRMTRQGALAGIVVGAATVLIWIYGPFTYQGQALSAVIFEIVPGFILSAVAIFVVSLLTRPPSEQMTSTFELMKSELKRQLA
ncbi:sodium/proline symporter PutP [Arenicella xantha]|uniref:Sodium/proline symporter n=1 Tax=Arenicella xantha TaxID=644221 RepID=A0A395JP48_9GAMM|nr:sodium/proline symporter PutP [Arenicella xantha]RBP53277.1 SSS family solute:Na+ symporter/sodium/proline symporter [Arenicella xantha]